MKIKRRRKRKAKQPKQPIKEADVPCGTCVECCKGDIIFLHPECGDRASDYQTKLVAGRYALAHDPFGDCVYLKKDGCSIYETRPVICRELDCKMWADPDSPVTAKALRRGAIHWRHVQAARRRVKRGLTE